MNKWAFLRNCGEYATKVSVTSFYTTQHLSGTFLGIFRFSVPFFFALEFWEFPNLVVSNLVVCTFYAEALFCALLRSFASFCTLLRSFADLRLRSFALFPLLPFLDCLDFLG